MDLEQFKMTFTDVLDAVCKYPTNYTMNGSFGEVLAFLDGYANGAKLGDRGRSSSYFNGYREWLCERMQQSKETDFWRYFRSSFPDEATTAAEFSKLWHEYQESCLVRSQRER